MSIFTIFNHSIQFDKLIPFSYRKLIYFPDPTLGDVVYFMFYWGVLKSIYLLF